MKYTIRKIAEGLAGPAGLLLVVAIPVAVISGCEYYLNRYIPKVENNNEVIEQVMQTASGWDQVMDKEEKSALLKELHIPGAIDETEKLEFIYHNEDTIRVYGSRGYRDYHALGITTKSNLLEYIATHSSEERK